jgi:hypothetical protein
MDVTTVAVIILLVMVTMWWVLKPLWQPVEAGQPIESAATRQTMEELLHRRDAVYAAIKDLELDLAANKIAEVDYRQMRSQLTRQAADILRRLDRLAESHDQDLEAEVDSLLLETPLDEQFKQQILAEVAAVQTESDEAIGEEIHCPNCQHALRPDDAFCSRCGTALVSRCPQCASETQPGDLFCTRCGTRLLAEAVE